MSSSITDSRVFIPESPKKLEKKITDWKQIAAMGGVNCILAAAGLAFVLAMSYYTPSWSSITHAQAMQDLPYVAGFFGGCFALSAAQTLVIACLLPRWNKELEQSRRIHDANGNRLVTPQQ